MSPYITFRDTDKDGQLQYYILQRAFPHWVGLVATNPAQKSIMKVPIAGYDMWVCFAGTLRGNVAPSYKDIDKEISAVLHGMANFYLEHRILTNPSKYKKWKLSAHPTTS